MHLRNRHPENRRALISVGAFCLLALSHGATAVPLDDWATGATTAVFDCTGLTGLALFCPLLSVSLDGPEGGGVMQDNASSTILDDLGNARANAELSPGAGLATPVLKTEAFSGSTDGGAVAAAFAVEAYTNTSGSTQSYILDFLLDAMVDDSTTAEVLDQGTVVVGTGIVVIADSGLYSFSDDFESVIIDLSLQSLISPEVFATDLMDLTALPNGGITQNLQATLSFDLDDGESAYVLALLTAQAMRDLSFADAFSTLTVEFRDATGLVSESNSGSTAVPEPGSLGLVALCAILILATRRRGRAAN